MCPGSLAELSRVVEHDFTVALALNTVYALCPGHAIMLCQQVPLETSWLRFEPGA